MGKKGKYNLDFSPIFDDEESLRMPDTQPLQVEPEGKINSWRQGFIRIIEKNDSIINLVTLVVIFGYIGLLAVGHLVDLVKGNQYAASNLKEGFAPIIWGLMGWLFGQKTRR